MSRGKTVPVPVDDLRLILDFLEKMEQAAQINRKIIARIMELIETDD